MDPERWRQVAHIYESALEREPVQRAAFVAEASGGDEDLRREVESLLAHESTPVLIDLPMLETAATILEEPPDLQPGVFLGPYRIRELLGAGGMGQVYHATDTRLNRSVAVKVLPRTVATDPQFRARFDREAQAIAALSHPNICTLHDICHQDGVDFLVMEYLEGETLAVRLEKGPLSLKEILRFSTEIADALAAAHRHGIIHRDLKPGNIVLTKGSAMLLDFGLAKSATPLIAGGPLLPTTAPSLTAQGAILGTLQYMAPEQLEGKDADARTDIFAFGAVIYEMLTRKKAFEGTSQASLIGAIMHADPAPIVASQPLTPPALDRFVKICLAKEPDDRWQSARDLSHELQAIGHDPSPSAIAGATTRRRLGWALAILFGISVAAVTVLSLRGQGRSPQVVRFVVVPPAGASLPPRPEPISPAISPDGLRLVFHVVRNGEPLLAIRSIDGLDAEILSGSEGGRFPFWKPDGRAIAFFSGGKLKRMNISGGPVQTICDAGPGFGGTWNRDDVIVFAPSAVDGLFRVPAAGGQPIALTSLKEGERYHQRPQFLADGRRFLYFAWPDAVYLGSLDRGASTRVLTSGRMALYSPSGHLLFVQDRSLVAQPFDPSRGALLGEPVAIGEDLMVGPPGGAGFSVSATGVLAYARDAGFNATLGWVDRAGRPLGTIGPFPFAAFADVELSPTGTQIAMQSPPGSTPNSDIWLFDLAHGRPTQLTFAAGADRRPIWSPDGGRLAFVSARQGAAGLYQKVVGGEQREELLLRSEDEGNRPWPCDWSSNGIVYESRSDAGDIDLWMLPLSGDRTPYAVVRERGNQRNAKVSPDGRWIAYTSNESGRLEVFVQSVLPTGGKWRISTGSLPVWRRDGKELFFVAADGKLMAVSVEANAAAFRPGGPQLLFQTGLEALGTRGSFDVSPDGERFLITIADAPDGVASIVVVANWTSALKQ